MKHIRLNLAFMTAGIIGGGLSYAVEPLTEESMSNISLESGSLVQLLSIDGSTAAGEDYIATQEDARKSVESAYADQTEANTAGLIVDKTQIEGKQTTTSDTNPDIGSFDSTETRIASSIKGDATSVFDPKQVFQEATITPQGGLRVDNGAVIDRVHILNIRDNNGWDRGNRFFTDIRASGSAVITGR